MLIDQSITAIAIATCRLGSAFKLLAHAWRGLARLHIVFDQLALHVLGIVPQ